MPCIIDSSQNVFKYSKLDVRLFVQFYPRLRYYVSNLKTMTNSILLQSNSSSLETQKPIALTTTFTGLTEITKKAFRRSFSKH